MRALFIVFLATTTFALGACSTAEKMDPSTPEGAFAQAEQYEKDDRFEEAVQKYAEVKNKHPYSRFAIMSELKIADVHYKREAYIEAQNAYQLFKDFHPKHPQIDYVTFRLAMSYFNQLPSTIDRDLSLTDKAITYFQEVATTFPSSAYAAEAIQHKNDCRRMQADKEMYVAQFYAKTAFCDSALKRFESVLKNYAGLGLEPSALFGAARCSFETGEKDRGLQHLKDLNSLYPGSDEARRARTEFAKYGIN